MKSILSISLLAAIALILAPAVAFGQSGQAVTGAPPVEQPLVREGMFAVKMAEILKLGSTSDEVEAESLLGAAGIAPRNGWISDYPVTPDILGELRKAVSESAYAGRVSLGTDEALKAFDDAAGEYGLPVKADFSGQVGDNTSGKAEGDTTVVNNYYYDQGPPVVTYYAPPPAYAYLYSWVPYPFWWWDVWFPGFFILADFHRVVIVKNHVHAISNHFFDHKRNRFFRVDHARRFHGKPFVSREGRWVSDPSAGRKSREAVSGVTRSGIRPDRNRTYVAPPGNWRAMTPSQRSSAVSPSRRDRSGDLMLNKTYGGFSYGGNTVSRRADRGTGISTPPGSGQRSFSSPATSGKTLAPLSTHRASGQPRVGDRGAFGGRHWR